MADPSKRRISARLILEDIRAGMDETGIRRKYQLPERGYQSVLEKLSAMGLLKESDTIPGSLTSRQEPRRSGPEAMMSWRCPACGTHQTRAYDECPHCGIVVAKAAAAMSYPTPAAPQSYESEIPRADLDQARRWTLVIVGIVLLVVVGGVWLKWSSSKQRTESVSAPPPTAESIAEAEDLRVPPVAERVAEIEELPAVPPPRSVSAPTPQAERVAKIEKPPAPRPAKPVSVPTPVPERVRIFTTANFDGAVKGASKGMPVVVMFYADW